MWTYFPLVPQGDGFWAAFDEFCKGKIIHNTHNMYNDKMKNSKQYKVKKCKKKMV